MAFDIYGNNLPRGHCELHPHVAEEWPCFVCIGDKRKGAINRERKTEVAKLVGALEEIIKAAPSYGPLWHGSNQIVEARAALAAYHKHGGKS